MKCGQRARYRRDGEFCIVDGRTEGLRRAYWLYPAELLPPGLTPAEDTCRAWNILDSGRLSVVIKVKEWEGEVAPGPAREGVAPKPPRAPALLKPIFFTSDWHVGHENVLMLDARPFRDLEHMHEVLVSNYNATVPPDGVCYFLGDVGLCSEAILTSVLSRLNGTKVLVLGNHDRNANAMYRLGFDVVLNTASLLIGGELVTLSHCPLRGVFREDTAGMKGSDGSENWHGERRHLKYSVEDRGQFHLHGHIHSGPANDKPRTLGRQMDVGVPANGYRPVSRSQVESWVARTKSEELGHS